MTDISKLWTHWATRGKQPNRTALAVSAFVTAMEEVARIKPLRKVEGFIAYACPSCRFTFGKILPAHGSRGEE